MIVTCPRLCRISIGNTAVIIPGIPSGRQATALVASGCPFASASRIALQPGLPFLGVSGLERLAAVQAAEPPDPACPAGRTPTVNP